MPDSETVTETLPEKKQRPLQDLYLEERLPALADRLGRVLVFTAFVTDKHGVVAKADEQGTLKVPSEIANDSDWRLFNELMAQADVIISTGSYLRRISGTGGRAQDILHQFEPGGKFADLGEWRLGAGFRQRSPDLAIVSRSMDFQLPERVAQEGRRILVFTSNKVAGSHEAKALVAAGAAVIGCGANEVDGNRMIDYLSDEAGFAVIMSASGPSVLSLLIDANRLDLLYVSEVQTEVPYDDPSAVRTLLPNGENIDKLEKFSLRHIYRQESVTTANGAHTAQLFRRYDRRGSI